MDRISLLEALSGQYTEIQYIDSPYILTLYVDGIKVNYVPVDFYISKIHTPITDSDIHFIYKDSTQERTPVYKNTFATDVFYPIGTIMTTIDQLRLRVYNYNAPIFIDNKYYINCYTRTVEDIPAPSVTETIYNTGVANRVKKDVNDILLINEDIKRMLPEYTCNFMNYTKDNNTETKANESYKYLYAINDELLDETKLILGLSYGDYITNQGSLSPNDQLSVFTQSTKYMLYKDCGMRYYLGTNKVKAYALAKWLIKMAIVHDPGFNYSGLYFHHNELNLDLASLDIECEANAISGYDITIKIYPYYGDYSFKITLGQTFFTNTDIVINEIHVYAETPSSSTELLICGTNGTEPLSPPTIPGYEGNNATAFCYVVSMLANPGNDQFEFKNYYNGLITNIPQIDINAFPQYEV